MQIFRRTILTAILGVTTSGLIGSAVVAQSASPTAQIQRNVGLSGVSGWIAIDLDTGKVLDQRQATRAFVPASVAKLPTAAFVLDALGPDYRFETQLRTNGRLRDGQLTGDLVLAGGGDPELSSEALAPLAKALKDRGVSSVKGGFYVDGTALPQLRQIEPSQQVYASYNPAISGLNLNYNRVHLVWDARQGRKDLVVQAESRRLTTPIDGVRVAVASRPGQPLFSLRRQDTEEVWQMSREAFRGRAGRWLPVKRPEAIAGEVFRIIANGQGIRLQPPLMVDRPRKGKVLASHQSRPLSEIVHDMMKHSTNLTAEVTGMAASRSVGLNVGTLKESSAVMNAWAASIAGFPANDPGFKFANHSGLSLDSRASPQRVAQFLLAFTRRAPKQDKTTFPGGLADYLKPYSMRKYPSDIDYDQLRVIAKTGTMNYVIGLAGYIATPGGKRLAFAIFSNDVSKRTSASQRIDKGWLKRARRLERALIATWVQMADGRT